MDRETEVQIRLECLKLAGGDRIMAAAHVKFVLGVADAAGRGPSEPKMDLSGLLQGRGGVDTKAEGGDAGVDVAGVAGLGPVRTLGVDDNRAKVAIPVAPSDDDIEAMAEAASNTDRASADSAEWKGWRQRIVRAYMALVDRHR